MIWENETTPKKAAGTNGRLSRKTSSRSSEDVKGTIPEAIGRCGKKDALDPFHWTFIIKRA